MHALAVRHLARLVAPSVVAIPAVILITQSQSSLLAASGPQQEQATTVVSVDFRVLARDGSPVLDLKPEEVALKVGSRDREIVALELVKTGGDAPAAAAPPLSPPYLTNASTVAGRSVVLVVDDEAIDPGQEAPIRDALAQLVEALTPADEVGLTTLKGGVVVHPTVRHDRVLQDIAGLRGLAGATDPTCRTRLAHATLMNLFENAVPSVPTLVVLVSNGLVAPSTTTLTAMGRGAAATGSATSTPCGEFTPGDLAALATAAAKSRVHVYGLEVFRGTDVSGGFENFANLTGNARVRLTGDTKAAMQRIANETIAYYVAAFEVTEQERTGASQRVAVTVNRPGVEVKAAPTLVIAKPAAQPGAKTAKADGPKLRDLLVSARAYRDLPLRANVYTSRMARQDGKPSVVCAFDSADPAAKIVEATVVLFDPAGKARAQWTAQPAAFRTSPVVAMFAAPAPGTYRMRLAAIDASGATGTLDEDVRVGAPGGDSVQTSALVLGTQGASGFAPRLEFVDEKVATAAVEIYGASKTADVAVTFEFAASEDGPAAVTLAGTVQSPGNDFRIAFVSVPAAQMPAGDFVVRAVITVDGKALDSKPFHTLRKVVR